ncbi:hypothetical protein Tcan_02450 [Toxocara canis]|uniref:Uncharacterized protein n=1 Tax=Toxocara canis TaxID=6265 RepID=A0A0B2UPI5_TOXCA|nr:hypothetical protein Tcan_02450 [Toxocara canis]
MEGPIMAPLSCAEVDASQFQAKVIAVHETQKDYAREVQKKVRGEVKLEELIVKFARFRDEYLKDAESAEQF